MLVWTDNPPRPDCWPRRHAAIAARSFNPLRWIGAPGAPLVNGASRHVEGLGDFPIAARHAGRLDLGGRVFLPRRRKPFLHTGRGKFGDPLKAALTEDQGATGDNQRDVLGAVVEGFQVPPEVRQVLDKGPPVVFLEGIVHALDSMGRRFHQAGQ